MASFGAESVAAPMRFPLQSQRRKLASCCSITFASGAVMMIGLFIVGPLIRYSMAASEVKNHSHQVSGNFMVPNAPPLSVPSRPVAMPPDVIGHKKSELQSLQAEVVQFEPLAEKRKNRIQTQKMEARQQGEGVLVSDPSLASSHTWLVGAFLAMVAMGTAFLRSTSRDSGGNRDGDSAASRLAPITMSEMGPAAHMPSRTPTTQMSILERPDVPLFCLNVCLRIKPERREEFLECIRANQKGTLSSEPLAVTYVYGEDETTPDTWHFFEQYVGREGFEAHTKTPHFANWETFAATEPFSAPPEVKFFVEDSAASVCKGAAQVRTGTNDSAKLFCLDVHMTVKPESREAFLEALRADQQGALTSEPQAVSYLFGEDTDTPNVFHMFEAYLGGRDGFAQHSKTPHYTKWAEFKATQPFAAPAKVGYYEIDMDGHQEGLSARSS